MTDTSLLFNSQGHCMNCGGFLSHLADYDCLTSAELAAQPLPLHPSVVPSQPWTRSERSHANWDVYHAIEADGTLSKMRFAVYSILFYRGPMTASEIAKALMENGANVKGGRSGPGNVGARLCELVDLHAAYALGTRTCKVTGNEVTSYDVTGLAPFGRISGHDGPTRPAAHVWQDAVREIRDVYAERPMPPSVLTVLKYADAKFGKGPKT